MRIIQRCHLDFSTLLFFLLSFCCGYFKQTIFLFFIVLWHEMGHVLAIHLCGYRFLKIDLYPFGGITKIEKPINSSINKEILISLAGVFFQSLLYGIFFLLFNFGSLSISSYQFLWKANTFILVFNLLPIVPLDGSITIHSLLEKVFSFEKAFFWYEMISFLSFFLFCIGNYYFHFDNYFVCGVLCMQFFLLKKEEKYYIKRFYLERYLKEYPYKRIKNENGIDLKKLKKETLHFFWDKEKYVHEKEVLKEYFGQIS